MATGALRSTGLRLGRAFLEQRAQWIYLERSAFRGKTVDAVILKDKERRLDVQVGPHLHAVEFESEVDMWDAYRELTGRDAGTTHGTI